MAAAPQLAPASTLPDDDLPPEGPPPALASATISRLAGALAKAQGEMKHALKANENTHFKSRYADLAGVIDACREALAKHGLSVVQRTLPSDGGVCLQTLLLHESGEWISDDGLYLPASKQDAQGYGSAMTYARRYGLAALVGIAQDDDDGSAAAASAPKGKAASRSAAKAPGGDVTREQQENLYRLLLKAGTEKPAAIAIVNASKKPDAYAREVKKAERAIAERGAEPRPPESIVPACELCAGRGVDPASDSGETCPQCNGTGTADS